MIKGKDYIDVDHKFFQHIGRMDFNNQKGGKMSNTKLITVDSNLTAATKLLYEYLQNINEDRILFGHQNTTTQGMTINKHENNGSWF